MSETRVCVGLMSGTSLDGVDAAVVRTDGERIAGFGTSLTVPYPQDLRAALRRTLGGTAPMEEIRSVERQMTHFHADVMATLLKQAQLKPDAIAVVGFHGQTILHRPEQGITWQIGDGALLAHLTGIPVVNDFRSADVRAGGQGAPLVPVFHAALAAHLPKPLAFLNLGGVANVTYIGEELIAFDTGPGNALLDDWMVQHTGKTMDADGALAASGISITRPLPSSCNILISIVLHQNHWIETIFTNSLTGFWQGRRPPMARRH